MICRGDPRWMGGLSGGNILEFYEVKSLGDMNDDDLRRIFVNL